MICIVVNLDRNNDRDDARKACDDSVRYFYLKLSSINF